MFQFRLSTVLVLFAVVAVLIAAWLSYSNVNRSVTLVSQSEPVLTVGSRSERQSYEISQSGTAHKLAVTFKEQGYPSQIFPQIEWTFLISDGTRQRWICKGLVVRWEMNSPDDAFLRVDDIFQGNTPYEVVPGPSYRIVKYWWVSNSSKNSITENLHFYLIANDSNKILAEHRLKVVVNVVVPKEISDQASDEVALPSVRE